MSENGATSCPVTGSERLTILDTLRGFAVLGILVMNIRSMGMPSAAYFFPRVWGDLEGLNGWFWRLGDLFADGRFISIFSMLFGAGIVLMNERARAAGRRWAGLHYRRMLVLLLLGLAHAYLLWDGDILVPYAVTGMVMFWFRNARPSRLLIGGLALLVIGSSLMCLAGWSLDQAPEDIRLEQVHDLTPPPEELAAQAEDMRGGFSDQMKHRVKGALEMHTMILPWFMFWRVGGLMLLGMALYKWGVLVGRSATRFYVGLVILGFGVGLPVTLWKQSRVEAVDWEPIRTFFVLGNYGYWASVLMALGWIGLIVLVDRYGLLAGLRRRLAAVGRMALSNYLAHSVIASFVFLGHGLGLYGQVPRIGLAGLVAAVWILQLVVSPWWLARFRFGPVEWAWRSASYLRRQPLRR
ncbi:MAG: DUF418 domain-containing protein [bacterium]|nr:DUF418 domain-containing protein [bacterium]